MFSAGVSSPSENRARGLHDLRRQSLQGGHVRGGRAPRSSLRPVMRYRPSSMRPARGQCRIDVHAAQEGIDRPRRIAQGDVAMAALLVQAAEARVQPLETLERRQRLRDPAQMALAQRDQIQHVAVLGHLRRASASAAAQRLGVAPALARARGCARTSSSTGEGFGCSGSASRSRVRGRAMKPAFDSTPARSGCPQNLKPILTPSTRGRSGTSDLMNCADEVNTLASELLRFCADMTSADQLSLLTPIAAS